MNIQLRKRRGPVPGNATVKCTFMIDPETHEWAINQHGGLSKTLRGLLHNALRAENLSRGDISFSSADLDLTPDAHELIACFNGASVESRQILLNMARTMREVTLLKDNLDELNAELDAKKRQMEMIYQDSQMIE